MPVNKFHILVTNDDGITAPGLMALAQELKSLGRVSVLAPDHNWSASGHVKTLHRPLRAKPTVLADGTPAFASDGAPSDCVLGLIPEKIDLVVSGINPNANLGHDVTYSGTVTAAMEAAIWGIPAVAVSLDSPEAFSGLLDYKPAARVGLEVSRKVLREGLPPYTLLNVNVPYLPLNEIKGYTITRQGMRIYRDELVRREDPRGRPYYWIGGDVPTGVPEKDTDFGALVEGYIAITPLQLDLTACELLKTLRTWDWTKPGA
jgi:5'-nucleotidase